MFDLSKHSFQAIIFDCDGTIANNMPLHYHAWVHGLKENGAGFIVQPEEIRNLAGKGIATIVELFNEKYGDKLDPKKVEKSKDEYFHAHEHEVEIIPEIEEVITQYHGKIPMAVASGSRTNSVKKTLKHLDLEGKMDHIVTVDDVEKGKPDPAMFVLAAEKMGIAPENCIVFEDGELGIQAAIAAGMKYFRVDSRL